VAEFVDDDKNGECGDELNCFYEECVHCLLLRGDYICSEAMRRARVLVAT
jgi:hypothetical protein